MDKLLVIIFFSFNIWTIESQDTQHFAYSSDVEDTLLRRLVFEQQIRIEKLENDLISVRKKLDTYSQEIELLKAQAGNETDFIGFTAFPSQTRTYTVGQRVLFDTIATNYGTHYNPTTGIFTCPRNGLYAFYTSLLSDAGYYMHGSIMKESQIYVTARGEGSIHEQGSAMVVLRCGAGERVWVEQNVNGANRLFQGRASMFTGILLKSEN